MAPPQILMIFAVNYLHNNPFPKITPKLHMQFHEKNVFWKICLYNIKLVNCFYFMSRVNFQ